MKKLNTTPISGMQEFLPEKQALFDSLKAKIAKIYRAHGYQSIETPAIDRLEILLAKAGGETEKQIYKVAKTAENTADADQGLRYDHTVPLARYVVEHQSELAFPLKVAQIGPCWRGERAQKGRFREFYQCDVDVIGRGALDLFYDADVIATLLDAYKQFDLETPVVARISNRKILAGLLEALQLTEKAAEIYHIVDHADKMPPEEVKKALEEIIEELPEELPEELSEELPEKGAAEQIWQLINLHGSRAEVTQALAAQEISNQTFLTGVEELADVMKALESEGLGERIEVDLKIVRGLDYYTGTVFEFGLPEHPEVGSVGGGGRYENLAEYFTEQQFPGVGGSIGLSRLFFALSEHNLLKSQVKKPIDYAVIPMSKGEVSFSLKIARKLRSEGHSVTVVHLAKKLGDKLAYAAKIAQNAIIVGEDEVQTGEYKVKNFSSLDRR